jgi:hypothetical protein
VDGSTRPILLSKSCGKNTFPSESTATLKEWVRVFGRNFPHCNLICGWI